MYGIRAFPSITITLAITLSAVAAAAAGEDAATAPGAGGAPEVRHAVPQESVGSKQE